MKIDFMRTSFEEILGLYEDPVGNILQIRPTNLLQFLTVLVINKETNSDIWHKGINCLKILYQQASHMLTTE